MQIFLPHKSVYLTAAIMHSFDTRRFNKQIIECHQIINAIQALNDGKKAPWYHHPIVLMYKDNLDFLKEYLGCFNATAKGEDTLAKVYSDYASHCYPEFLKDADWYFENMCKRLYTKDPIKYEQFSELGKSYSNFYYVDGIWKEYKQ